MVTQLATLQHDNWDFVARLCHSRLCCSLRPLQIQTEGFVSDECYSFCSLEFFFLCVWNHECGYGSFHLYNVGVIENYPLRNHVFVG